MSADYESPWKEALDVYFEALLALLFAGVPPAARAGDSHDRSASRNAWMLEQRAARTLSAVSFSSSRMSRRSLATSRGTVPKRAFRIARMTLCKDSAIIFCNSGDSI